LIKAFHQSKASETYKLIIAGPDSYDFGVYLKKLVVSLGLFDKVIFTGRVSGYDKWYLLENSVGLFLPSTGEGWPVVIAEAIGAKVPLVISKECNFSKIIDYNIGIEVDDFDTGKWAKAIDFLCFNQEQRNMFRQNLNVMSDSFSWSNIVQQWINKYNSFIR
jgi:glycosyltransferase involved in cell wall biosynthesis